MDEQRSPVYLSRIQELLDCFAGEENDVLNRHLELVDDTMQPRGFSGDRDRYLVLG